MSDVAFHIPKGEPCETCGRRFLMHRVSHECIGDPCTKCGLPPYRHRYMRHNEIPDAEKQYFIGIDGEGVTENSHHRYVMMCAADEFDEQSWIVRPKPGYDYLQTEQCLDFILDLPERHTKIFSFAFGYDLTMMLQDCDNRTLYNLFRPEEPCRQRSKKFAHLGPKPVSWKGYKLNLQGTKFSVEKDGRRKVIWDLFKFFQGKFVSALKKWNVGTVEIWDRMSGMKDNRATFAELIKKGIITIEQVARYCYEECACMAKLARRLTDAHKDAGLKLKHYYGAGSSGGAMLDAMGIKEKNVRVPWPMRHAVSSSFFGGRFENGRFGPVKEKVFMKDISSAYPYQSTFLPCLEHGEWRLTKNRADIDKARVALVQYCFSEKPITSYSWGPFPFRGRDGSISFPEFSGGGWVWDEEYREGERLWPHVRFKQAWVYHQHCDHRPFNQIPEYYLLRLSLDKEGAGLVIKLAMNSTYGKLAQSVGNAIFNNWIWAALITSGCRAQLLNALGRHDDWDRVLMFATDSIASLDDITTATPKITGTEGTGKPLGGWESKNYDNGFFLARPGIYFPMAPTEKELDMIKARGIGRSVLLNNWQAIVDSFHRTGGKEKLTIANIQRFCGAKTSISKDSEGYNRASGGRRKINGLWQVMPAFGEWVPRKVEMSFDPLPKRDGIGKDGRLKIRSFPADLQSMPYKKAVLSQEARALKEAMDDMMEQPDIDYVETEVGA